MPQTKQALCRECKSVDLASYFRQELHVFRDYTGAVGPGQGAVMLKSLADVYTSAKSCDLCRIILSALCKRFEPQSWETPEEYLARMTDLVEDPAIYLYSYMHAEDFRSMVQSEDEENVSMYRSFRLGIGLSTATDVWPVVKLAGMLQLVESSCESLGLDPDFHGRIVHSERANMRLAREWLDECIFKHRSLCQQPSMEIAPILTRPNLEDLRVIDVDRMCLCFLPPGDKFITLSYRWAASPLHFTLTTTNVTELEVEASLRHHFQQMPQTIQDTINCVRELGERFLWVDALCIVQDSPEDKQRLIGCMDQIYENSLITIIAAPPSEVYYPFADGLPGYCPGTRLFEQDRACVHGLEICTSFLSVDMALVDCPWGSRAWTFQEELLSRRRLYFTASQVYFQCACGVFCEDVVGEGKSIWAYVYSLSSLWNRATLYARIGEGQSCSVHGLSRIKFQTHIESIRFYKTIVEEYTQRHMTDQGDALTALNGVLAVLEYTMNTRFVCGLPEAYFDEAILWVTRGPCKRRRVITNDMPHKHFPSWIWAGWDAQSCYRGHSVGRIRREAKWFLVSEDGHMTQLEVLPSQDSSSELHQCLNPDNGDLQVELPNLKPRSSIKLEDVKASSLACLSSIAIFRFLGDTLPERHLDWPEHQIFIISDSHDRPVGAMWIEDSWSHRIENQVEFEFVLLSRSESVEFVPEFDESMFPSTDWSHVNVMLVERRGSRAERLGISVVHENAWVAACPVAVILYLE